MKKLDFTSDFLFYEGSLSNDPADAVKIKNRIQDDAVKGINRLQIQLVNGTIDQEISLADADSDYLFIYSDRQIGVKLNGSSDAITLTPRANSIKTLVFMLRGSVTGVLLSNSSGATVNIDIISVNN